MPRFPAPHTLAAFSIRPRIHFGRLPRLDCHITDCFHQHHYIVPHPSQRRLTAPTVQFSAGIVILCGVRREPPTSAGSDPATGGTDQTRTGGLLIPNQARYQLRYGSILAAERCVLRAIFTNDFCPRCCVWRTSATRTFMGSDFLHSGTLVRTSQTRMVSQHLSAMKSFNTFSANSSCGRMDS